MSKIFQSLLLVALLLSTADAARNDALTLDSSAKPEIILSSEPTTAEAYAAKELSTYLEKLIAVKVPIRKGVNPSQKAVPIFVGWQPANADLKPETLNVEESIVAVEPGRIRLVGGRGGASTPTPQHDRGTLYAVYDLLNELGVRWYRPEPWGEHVPQQASHTLPTGQRRTDPVYKYRYGMANYQTFYPHPATMTAAERELNEAEWEMMRKWGIRNRLNTNLRKGASEEGGSYRINFAHAYEYLVPPSRYFESHPEYFALINGKRSSNPLAQLCVSNPDVQEIAAQSLRRTMAQSPGQDIFSIGPNDGHLWCQCDACTALDDPKLISTHTGKVSMSNRTVYCANTIAKQLAKEFPDKKVGWYAYSGETEVPTLIDQLEPNTAVMAVAFAGSFSDYSRPLNDPSSRQNRHYRKILEGWKAATEKSGSELLTYDYWAFYLWPGPLPVIHTMTDRLRHYHRDFGVVGQYNETHPCWGPQGIGYYFYTWLLRHPDADVEAEKQRYYTNYYGPAAEPMRAYHEKLEAVAQNGPYFGSGGYQIENLFTQDLLNTLKPMITEAASLAEGKAPYDRRVDGTLAGYEYARRFAEFRLLRSSGKMVEALKALDDLAAYFNSFEDGSVFDVRSSNRGSWSSIFARIRKDVDKGASLFALFEQPKVLQQHEKKWRFAIDPDAIGLAEGWTGPMNDTGWALLDAGKTWQDQGYPNHHGAAWYRRSIDPPTVGNGQRIILYFEAVDGDAHIYLNGKAIGEHLLGENGAGYDDPFYFDVTDILKPGEANLLAIRVTKTTAVGGLTGKVNLLQVDAIRAPVE